MNNKSKLLIALLTAATMVGSGAFAGCNDEHTHTYSDDWTKDATGHWHVATCDDLKAGDEDYKKDFAAHVWGNDDECDVCHYTRTPTPVTEYTVTLVVGDGTLEAGAETTLTTVDGKLATLPTPTPPADMTFKGWYTAETDGDKVDADYTFTGDTTIYAVYVDGTIVETEFTVTLHVGAGTVAEGTTLTYTTVDGKLPFGEGEFLPEPTIATAHWSFDNWYDEEVGGTAIDEATTVFTADTDIYARYIRDNGVWVGDTFINALIRNTGNMTKTEYWLGGTKITLEKDAVINLYMDGKLVSHYVEPNSAGIVKPASSLQVTSVTTSIEGEFAIYLHKNASDWSCEYSGPTAVNVGSEIPEGCDAVKVTIGTKEVTFYLKDSAGNPVGADDFGKFCIYTYNSEIFGTWATSTTKGKLSAEMTGTGTAIPEGWIFRWGTNYGSQTSNIIGAFTDGKTYLVELPAAHQGTATITELNVTAAE